MQTSQEVLARKEFERVTQLVPQEPAGWANLGLLLMRQQETEAAATHLRKAGELAGGHAPIQRLLALLESRNGRLPEAVPHWKSAMAADPSDLKAPYALALDLERAGGDASLEGAQHELEALAARTGNLAVHLELARIAARRGDAAALGKAIAPLREAAASWTQPAQEQLRELEAAAANPAAAATRVAFLKNVLLREAAYRAALAAVSTPRAEIGEPLARFVAPARTPRRSRPRPTKRSRSTWRRRETGPRVRRSRCGRTGKPPRSWSARGRRSRSPAGRPARFPAAPAPFGVVPLDFDYDYRTDLLLAGADGVRLLHQLETGAFADVNGRVPPEIARARRVRRVGGGRRHGRRPRRGGGAGHGAGRRAAQQRRRDVRGAAAVRRARRRARLRVGGPRRRRRAGRDAAGRGRGGARVPEPPRRRCCARTRAARLAGQAAIAAVGGREMPFDVVGVAADGAVRRLGWSAERAAWRSGEIARIAPPAGLAAGTARLVAADLDNNGASDLIVAGAGSSRVLLGGALDAFTALAAEVPMARARGAPTSTGRPPGAGGDRGGRPSRARDGARDQAVRLAGPAPALGHRDRRPAHQLVRHRRRGRAAHRPAPAAPHDRGAVRALRPRRGPAGGGRPHRLAERHPAVGVQHGRGRDHRRQPAPQGLVPVAVRVERPRDGLRDRPHLALAARPAHQRPGDGRRVDDRGLGEGPGRSAGARATVRTTCASPPSCGRRTSSTCSRCWWSTTRRARRSSSTSASRSRRLRSR